jgi:hypothetical protein
MLAVVADDEGAEYLFPPTVEPWLGATRLQQLVEIRGEEPTSAAEWTELATYNLGLDTFIDASVEVEDVDDAVDQAESQLADYEPESPETSFLDSVSESYDQVSADYPGFGDAEDVDGNSAQAMENFVLMALGPIDPDGPNGWLLRAQDGSPDPGDEDRFIHFPGAPLRESEAKE